MLKDRPFPVHIQQLELPERLLLGPGPSTADPRILQAMTASLLGHLDPAFLNLMDRTQELLRYVFQTENRLTISVPGTGSAAMEAAIANLVEPGDRILVCINGYFGNRLADMAKRYGGVVQTLQKSWGEVFTTEEVGHALEEHSAQVLALVHAETSTGALQPVTELLRLAHDRGVVVILDAVTSLGGLPLLVDEWEIDACYSGAQKCLSCPPGASPITFGSRAIEKLNRRKSPVANWYLDLTSLQKYWGVERLYHHTAPISTNYALYEGLVLAVEEGLQERWNRHRRNAELLWRGAEALGLEMHVPETNRLPSLTTIRVPVGVDEMAVRKRLLDTYNIEIGGGLGELKGKVWRVGLMGYSSQATNVERLLVALKAIL